MRLHILKSLVVPNVMGIALYSPLINEAMNSVRGLQFAHHLVSKFPLHEFDSVKSPSILKF